MVLLEKAEKPFEYTAKRTPRRSAIVNTYEEEINAAYDAFEGTNGPTILVDQDSKTGSYVDMLDFVREVVNANTPHKLGDDDDIFRAGGGDRYIYIRIRLSILS